MRIKKQGHIQSVSLLLIKLTLLHNKHTARSAPADIGEVELGGSGRDDFECARRAGACEVGVDVSPSG